MIFRIIELKLLIRFDFPIKKDRLRGEKYSPLYERSRLALRPPVPADPVREALVQKNVDIFLDVSARTELYLFKMKFSNTKSMCSPIT